MADQLPPLSSLRAFEAVARLGSVSRAAEDLGVSQPAVTQQLRKLEEFLGVKLVERTGSGMRLTERGEAFASPLHKSFALMHDALKAVRGQESLTLAVLGTFAQRWLIPRLADLQSHCPGLDLRLLTTSRLEDLERPDVDLAIRSGDGKWPGVHCDFLMDNAAYPVLAPSLMAQKPLRRPEDLKGHILIQVESHPRALDWSRWLAKAGVPDLEPKGWLSFENSSHALEAAMAGAGVAMGHTPFIAEALMSGRLIAPLKVRIDEEIANYLVFDKARLKEPKIQALRTWLLEQIEKAR